MTGGLHSRSSHLYQFLSIVAGLALWYVIALAAQSPLLPGPQEVVAFAIKETMTGEMPTQMALRWPASSPPS